MVECWGDERAEPVLSGWHAICMQIPPPLLCVLCVLCVWGGGGRGICI